MRVFLVLFASLFLFACDKPAPTGDPEGPSEARKSPGEKAKAMVAAGAQLVDVRSPGEFNRGAIEGAVNIPVQELSARMGELDKTKPVVVYCASGMRSGSAKGMLEGAGFSDVFNMGGKRAW